MEGDSQVRFSDEYRLLETYCLKRRKPGSRPVKTACMYSMQAQMGPIGGEKFGHVAEKLTLIADSTFPEEDGIEPDGSNDDFGEYTDAVTDTDKVIGKLVELLKMSGDDLNNKIQNNQQLVAYLQHTFSYNFFDKLAKTFISSMVQQYPQRPSKREEIALTFEVTSRLEALDLQPMNRVMGYGAQYLQTNFAPWVKQRGGWEKVFDDDDEEVH